MIIVIISFGTLCVILSLKFLIWLGDRKYKREVEYEKKRQDKIKMDSHFGGAVNK